jgi:flagellar hook-length control protein FliK
MPELALPQRVNDAGWSQALGERLVVMAGRGQQVAEIKLNPAHLGPLEVKVSLQHDQASVSFLAQHAPVREALEQAIPRLREMFNQQDLQLVNVDVGQRRDAPAGGGEGSARGQGGGMAGGRGANNDTAPIVELPISSQTVDADRRLDLYA